MTAKEAKIEALWRSLPSIIQVKIEKAIECGQLTVYFYKSVTSEVFKDIDTTIAKLQLLGYSVEYGKVDIEEDSEACGISTDMKLTIKW